MLYIPIILFEISDSILFFSFLLFLFKSLAELTFDMVSPGPNYKSSIQPKNSASGVHPAELREGVANAYTVLTEVCLYFGDNKLTRTDLRVVPCLSLLLLFCRMKGYFNSR